MSNVMMCITNVMKSGGLDPQNGSNLDPILAPKTPDSGPQMGIPGDPKSTVVAP